MAQAGRFVVSVTTNAAALARGLDSARVRQLPFATAKALTRTAQDARDAARREMPFRFTIRNRGVVRRITINAARKSDWPRPFAEIGHRDEFMTVHETGGIRRPGGGAKRQAIPTREVQRRRTRTGRIPRRLQPRVMISADRAEIQEQGARGGPVIRQRRKGKGKRRKRESVLFFLRRGARYKRRWGFRDIVSSTAAKVYDRHLRRELEAALRTARR